MRNHSAAIQREKILNYLKEHGSATTIELRHKLDILAPAPRVHELRHEQNHNIKTTWSHDENPDGTVHRVGLYSLHEGLYKEVRAS